VTSWFSVSNFIIIGSSLPSWICDEVLILHPIIDFPGSNIVLKFHFDWLDNFRQTSHITDYRQRDRESDRRTDIVVAWSPLLPHGAGHNNDCRSGWIKKPTSWQQCYQQCAPQRYLDEPYRHPLASTFMATWLYFYVLNNVMDYWCFEGQINILFFLHIYTTFTLHNVIMHPNPYSNA